MKEKMRPESLWKKYTALGAAAMVGITLYGTATPTLAVDATSNTPPRECACSV